MTYDYSTRMTAPWQRLPPHIWADISNPERAGVSRVTHMLRIRAQALAALRPGTREQMEAQEALDELRQAMTDAMQRAMEVGE